MPNHITKDLRTWAMFGEVLFHWTVPGADITEVSVAANGSTDFAADNDSNRILRVISNNPFYIYEGTDTNGLYFPSNSASHVGVKKGQLIKFKNSTGAAIVINVAVLSSSERPD